MSKQYFLEEVKDVVLKQVSICIFSQTLLCTIMQRVDFQKLYVLLVYALKMLRGTKFLVQQWLLLCCAMCVPGISIPMHNARQSEKVSVNASIWSA